jgi:Undecaprenyl-phosphate galactose phosphotransferase WbaP
MEIDVKPILPDNHSGNEETLVNRYIPVRISQFWTILTLIASDIISMVIVALLIISLQTLILDKQVLSTSQFVTFIILCICANSMVGLYPGFSMSPVEEMKKNTVSFSIIFLVISVESFWFSDSEKYSYLFLSVFWIFCLGIVPLGRSLTRSFTSEFGFIGEPTVVIGFGQLSKAVLQYLKDNEIVGLRPVAMIDLKQSTETRNFEELPVISLNKPEELHNFSNLSGIKTGIMVLSESTSEFIDAASKMEKGGFHRMIFIPSEKEINSLGVKPFDLGSYSGLEVKWRLFNNLSGRWLKRFVDIILVISGGLIIFPFLLLLAIIVKLDSKGSVFYGHTRIGKDKRKFKAWKFRTMVPNADKILEVYLENDPELRKEWESSFKIRNDPRITRVGKILRKLSLDEFPQIWNVLVGEMSLIGPRPIVSDEIKCYGDVFEMYALVRPGITGLWQVSGRNDSSYEFRVRLDKYYISNWSIWLDLYILALTVKAVFAGKGAY